MEYSATIWEFLEEFSAGYVGNTTIPVLWVGSRIGIVNGTLVFRAYTTMRALSLIMLTFPDRSDEIHTV